MSAAAQEPMLPDNVVMEGFIEQYDFDKYPDVQPLVYVQHCHVMADPDLPAPVQIFAEEGRIKHVRLFFDGYFIAPLKHMAMNPGETFAVLARLVEMEPHAPRWSRLRYWSVRQLLRLAASLLA